MADVTEIFCDVFYNLFGVVDIVSIFSIAWRSPELPHCNAYKKFVSSHTTLFRQNTLDVQCHLHKDLYSYCVYQCDLSVISICGLNSRTKPKNSIHHRSLIASICSLYSVNDKLSLGRVWPFGGVFVAYNIAMMVDHCVIFDSLYQSYTYIYVIPLIGPKL